MKIIAGEFRSRTLTTPKGSQTRPTMSQLRATVFNICQQYVSDCRFLDICAGSGGMGLEAISRGAAQATFIDQNREAIDIIKHNIGLLGVEKKSLVLCQEALIAMNNLIARGQCYDLCYFDPPYGSPNDAILSLLDTSPLLTEGAFFFMEESIKHPVNTEILTHLQLQSKRRVGNTQLYCFRKK